MLTLLQFAAALGGRVVSGGVSFRPPGHGPGDMSARILLDTGKRNGYSVTSFAGDDPLALRDFVDARCGLSRWEERERRHNSDPRELARQAQVRERQRRAREAEDATKAERVASIWREAQADPRGTLVERFLNQHRNLDLPRSVCGHAVRFHPAGVWGAERVPMMICSFRDIVTNRVVGLHRTRLDPITGDRVGRKMLGRAAGAAIKLTPDAEVASGLAIAEGVETALSGIAFGLDPIWALGSAGGIAGFPTLPGIECLTLLGENDASGTNQRACEQAAERWHAAAREVDIIFSRVGKDLNDALIALRAGAAA